MHLRRATILLAGLFATVAAWSQSLPIGNLTHDGPATPEQLSLVLPVTGSLPTTATAAVRYRATGSGTWTTGHPLYRVRPSFSNTPAVGSVQDVFAWPILNLSPGVSYEVEATVTSGASTDVRTATFTTRALPGAAGAATKTIASGTSGTAIQTAFNGLNAGDVLEFADGTYDISGLVLNRSGTAQNPIYIRGASRAGVVLRATSGAILRLVNTSNVVVENMTLQGSGVDGGVSTFHWGVFAPDSSTVSRFTLRNVNINGVNQGVVFDKECSEVLVYDNTLVGNNLWNSTFVNSNLTWSDDGIRPPGTGNAVFNNSLRGFGDSLAVAGHSGDDTLTEARGVHFYRNDIRNSGDDLFEADHGHRNLSFYDNRAHNMMTFVSLDPLYGGPLVVARNVIINVGRTPFKWNDQNTGQFVYSNTIVIAERDANISGWYQPNNGQQRSYGYRNNVLIYRGTGTTLWLESGGHDPIDFTHNSWYPDKQVQWGGAWSNLAAAQAAIPATAPVFSGQTKRLFQDNITTSDPFSPSVVTGAGYLNEVTQSFAPAIAAGTTPKNSGVAIPNITDGFSGSAPDRGAIIAGRGVVTWGDRNSTPSKTPNPPTNVTVN